MDDLEEPGRSSRTAALRTVLLGGGLVVVAVVGVLLVASLAERRADPQVPSVAVDELGEALGEPTLGDRPGPRVQEPLPDATFAGFDDGPAVTLSDYRGRPLVLNFWATWCAPCVAEMPDLQQVATELGDEVAFLGINHQDAPSNAASFAERLGITYDLAADPEGGYLEEEIRGFGMPTTLLVDADGTIVYRQTGPVTAEELRALIATELGVGRLPAEPTEDEPASPSHDRPVAPVG